MSKEQDEKMADHARKLEIVGRALVKVIKEQEFLGILVNRLAVHTTTKEIFFTAVGETEKIWKDKYENDQFEDDDSLGNEKLVKDILARVRESSK